VQQNQDYEKKIQHLSQELKKLQQEKEQDKANLEASFKEKQQAYRTKIKNLKNKSQPSSAVGIKQIEQTQSTSANKGTNRKNNLAASSSASDVRRRSLNGSSTSKVDGSSKQVLNASSRPSSRTEKKTFIQYYPWRDLPVLT